MSRGLISMSHYQTFTATDAIAYAKKHGGLEDPSVLVSADEIGDGNLNLVFKIRDEQNNSRIIVKQALPYVRCVGESWPLTLDRARIEAQTLIEHYKHCPQHTVKIYHYDAELAVIVMEDLSSHQIWRNDLIQGKHYPQASQQLGKYLAETLFHTSDFYLAPHKKKALVAQFINPEMCEITEDLFFNDPYIVHERNSYATVLENDVENLRNDHELKIAVAALKHRFFSHAEALLHGDIHSGSIFVADDSLKVIDAEFGYFGPIGFDIGTAIGNLLLNYCGVTGLLSAREAAKVQEQRLNDIRDLWFHFSALFTQLAKTKTRDIALSSSGYVGTFLQKIFVDSIGFCGTELIRRTVGLSHVLDLENIADEGTRYECARHAIRLGRQLILSANQIDNIDELITEIKRIA